MKPNYVAKKAGGHYAWKKLGWSKLLILPVVFAWAPMAIKAKSEKVEFYDDYIVEKKGVFRKETNTYVLPGVYSVATEQSFRGRLGNFGKVKVGVVGKPLPVDLSYVKRPKKLKAYLDTKIMDPKKLRIIMGTDKLKF